MPQHLPGQHCCAVGHHRGDCRQPMTKPLPSTSAELHVRHMQDQKPKPLIHFHDVLSYHTPTPYYACPHYSRSPQGPTTASALRACIIGCWRLYCHTLFHNNVPSTINHATCPNVHLACYDVAHTRPRVCCCRPMMQCCHSSLPQLQLQH
jgi:hypothetical protein